MICGSACGNGGLRTRNKRTARLISAVGASYNAVKRGDAHEGAKSQAAGGGYGGRERRGAHAGVRHAAGGHAAAGRRGRGRNGAGRLGAYGGADGGGGRIARRSQPRVRPGDGAEPSCRTAGGARIGAAVGAVDFRAAAGAVAPALPAAGRRAHAAFAFAAGPVGGRRRAFQRVRRLFLRRLR